MNRVVFTMISIVATGIVISSIAINAQAQQQVKVEATQQKNVAPLSRGKLTLGDWLRMMK